MLAISERARVSLRLVPGLEEKVLSISQPIYGRVLHRSTKPDTVELYDDARKKVPSLLVL